MEDKSKAPLEARRRRMERRRASSKRTILKDEDDGDEDYDDNESYNEETPDESGSSEEDASNPSALNNNSKKRKTPLSQIRGIKKQARYEPEVPMSKSELAAWRKEARRVRNRESAAASRQKTRQRIEELEAQVGALQSRYDAAVQRIQELEQGRTTPLAGQEPTKVLSGSPVISKPIMQVSPPLSPREGSAVMPGMPPSQWSLPHQQAAQALADSLTTYNLAGGDHDGDVPDGKVQHGLSSSPFLPLSQQQQSQQQQHPVKISRPTAV